MSENDYIEVFLHSRTAQIEDPIFFGEEITNLPYKTSRALSFWGRQKQEQWLDKRITLGYWIW